MIVRTKDGQGDAAEFSGGVLVNGELTKASGGFLIDHPLDPTNKYLYHSFVESPDMMNVYSGNSLLDSKGEAWVTLPGYFDALNDRVSYHLTPIGGPSPGLYVAAGDRENRFRIAGGPPGLQVSWLVTGVRADRYARAHRIVPEVLKDETARGRYLHAREWGQPDSRRIDRTLDTKARLAADESRGSQEAGREAGRKSPTLEMHGIKEVSERGAIVDRMKLESVLEMLERDAAEAMAL
jgi:hypothetical protein